jgi:DNA-binding MarR family transcriptional regulator
MHWMAPSPSLRSKFRETLGRLYQRFNALQRGEKRCFGVTMSQCVTLEFLHREGPKTVRELAEGQGLDTSTVTRVVDVLVRDGLLRRNRDEKGDRRCVYVSLTARGRAMAGKLEDCSDRYTERILERIPADRREDVLHALRVLVDVIDEMPGACG